MSEKGRLPVCDVCKEYPIGGGTAVSCMTPGCGMRGAVLDEADWRRLMDRPRLAPEHVETLRFLLCYYAEYEKRHGLVVGSDTRAIRAALAALGE